jgi:hypothetical protein
MVTLASQRPGSLLTVASGEQVTPGGCVSRTETWEVQEAVLPLGSRAVQVTFVVPTGKALPLAGVHVNVTPQASDAEAP